MKVELIVMKEEFVVCLKEAIYGRVCCLFGKNATKWKELAKEAVDEYG